MIQCKSTDKTLDAKCHSSLAVLSQIREEWDEFVESVGGDIYVSFDWINILRDNYAT